MSDKFRNYRKFKTRLQEHHVAVALLVTSLFGYLLVKGFPFLGPKWSGILEHTLLTLAVVMFVHVLDHMYLSQGYLRLIHREFKPVSEKVRISLRRLEKALSSFDAMRNSGMSRIYSSRSEACVDIARELTSEKATKIRLIGVSLNDFILDNKTPLNAAYQMIVERMKTLLSKHENFDENGEEINSDEELDVKILIIDPYSFGAQQRHKAEIQEVYATPGRLASDVRTAAERLQELKAELNRLQTAEQANSPDAERGLPPRIMFDCRMYRVAPQLFLSWTNQSCYVEQYYFWSSRDAQSTVPVFRFQKLDIEPTPLIPFEQTKVKNIHSEMERHFDWIWNHASISVEDFVDGKIIGHDMGLCQAGAVNVFMDQERTADRIISLLKNAKDDCEIDLMGISLRSFFEVRLRIAQAFTRVLQRPHAKVRILCIDTESEQAKMRSYCEAHLGDAEIQYDRYKENENLHKESTLYRDTESTKKRLRSLRFADTPEGENDGKSFHTIRCQLSAWEYSCAPSCFMLRVDDSVLFEPYSYGKLDLSAPNPTLSGDMPVFEFHRNAADLKLFEEVPNRNPWGLLKDHFEFVISIAKPIEIQMPRPNDKSRKSADQ